LSAGKYILGLMSGSSLDGLDIALIFFSDDFYESNEWRLVQSATIPYSPEWVERLKSAVYNKEVDEIHNNFGTYLGTLVNEFLLNTKIHPELIALHGHTLYHRPEDHISLQLGAAQALADRTNFPAMDNFRIQDILLGGQGAPLAPTVEHWLFSKHKIFLNIGGIVNISSHLSGNIVGFDIGPGNQLLNTLSQEVGMAYDEGGQLGKKGIVIKAVLNQAKENEFYRKAYPKSLSNQWVQQEVIPIFQNREYPIEDRMATAIELIGWSLEIALDQMNITHQKIIVTGGGAFNTTLIDHLQRFSLNSNNQLIVASEEIVNYKEAILMGLMGFLNITGSNNIFGISTGSKINHCAGNLCVPNSFPLV